MTDRIFPSYVNRKNIIRILIAFLVALILGRILFYVLPKSYYSTAKVYFNTSDLKEEAEVLQQPATLEIATSYNSYLVSDFLKEIAYESLPASLREKYSEEEVVKMLSTELVSSTSAIHIVATCPTPEDAVFLVNFYAQFALDYIHDLINIGVYEVYEEADRSESTQFPSLNLITMILMALGILYTILTVLLEDYADFNVKSQDDLTSVIRDAPVLGTIPHVKEKKPVK